MSLQKFYTTTAVLLYILSQNVKHMQYDYKCDCLQYKKGHFQSAFHNSPASDISLRISQTRLQTQEFITVQPGKEKDIDDPSGQQQEDILSSIRVIISHNEAAKCTLETAVWIKQLHTNDCWIMIHDKHGISNDICLHLHCSIGWATTMLFHSNCNQVICLSTKKDTSE